MSCVSLVCFVLHGVLRLCDTSTSLFWPAPQHLCELVQRCMWCHAVLSRPAEHFCACWCSHSLVVGMLPLQQAVVASLPTSMRRRRSGSTLLGLASQCSLSQLAPCQCRAAARGLFRYQGGRNSTGQGLCPARAAMACVLLWGLWLQRWCARCSGAVIDASGPPGGCNSPWFAWGFEGNHCLHDAGRDLWWCIHHSVIL